jgi:competence protein ComEA
MWKLEFSRSTLAWLLGAALVLGLGIELVRIVTGREATYPLTIVEGDAQVKVLQARADSMLAMRKAAAEAPVRINSATAADFERLDGIGKVLAARIVAYRTEHGLFTTVDELDNVSGIGPKRLEALRGHCVVDTL